MESPIRETDALSPTALTEENNEYLEKTSIIPEQHRSVEYLKEVSPTRTATPRECIDHLRFLTTPDNLRRYIRTKDGLFEIHHPGRHFTADTALHDGVEEKRLTLIYNEIIGFG